MTGLCTNTHVFGLTRRVLFGAILLAGLAACGDDDAPPGGAAADGSSEAAWSAPASGEPRVADGSPDGDAALGAATPQNLLATLRARVAGGDGMADARYEAEVRDVAEVLWPADGSAEERSGGQVHVQVSAIAAQVGGWLKGSDTALAEREKSDPIDVKIYTAFLQAAAAGPDAYRAWCEAAGASLLKELAAARRARFFPKR